MIKHPEKLKPGSKVKLLPIELVKDTYCVAKKNYDKICTVLTINNRDSTFLDAEQGLWRTLQSIKRVIKY